MADTHPLLQANHTAQSWCIPLEAFHIEKGFKYKV